MVLKRIVFNQGAMSRISGIEIEKNLIVPKRKVFKQGAILRISGIKKELDSSKEESFQTRRHAENI